MSLNAKFCILEVLKIFHQYQSSPHFPTVREGKFQKRLIFSNTFLFPPTCAFWALQKEAGTPEKSIKRNPVLSKNLHHVRINAEEKILESQIVLILKKMEF